MVWIRIRIGSVISTDWFRIRIKQNIWIRIRSVNENPKNPESININNIGGKKNGALLLIVAINFTKLNIIWFLNRFRKNETFLTWNWVFFNKKTVTKLSEIWVRDPRSGKKLFQVTDPDLVFKKAPDPGSGSSTLFLLNQMPSRQGISQFRTTFGYHVCGL